MTKTKRMSRFCPSHFFCPNTHNTNQLHVNNKKQACSETWATLFLNTLKKPQTYKPDSVFRQPFQDAKISAIYLVPTKVGICAAYPPCTQPKLRLREPRSYPPSRCAQWRINKVYMAFQPARFIHPDGCPPESCALTARFHLYPP